MNVATFLKGIAKYVACCLCCVVMAGQSRTAKPIRIDAAKIAAHIRRLNMWPDEVQIVVGKARPSEIRGLLVLPFHADAGHGITVDDSVLVSADGQWLLRANQVALNQDTFSRNLEYLSLSDLAGYGPTSAKVTITVFGDFQCPACREESLALRDKVPSLYAQRVRVVFADFPLEGLHDWSKSAAIAGRCVLNQSKSEFWVYHDWVYRGQEKYTASNFIDQTKQFTQTEKLDSEAFNTCLSSPEALDAVERNITAGRRLSITVLPTVFVNGRRLENPRWPDLQRAIDFELQKPGAAPCGCSIDP